VNDIVYVAFRGTSPTARRAIYEALLERGVEATHTWLLGPAHPGDLPRRRHHGDVGSPESIAALERADLVVSNDHIPLDWEKKPGARYLQTWHGTPLKRIHNDVRWAPKGRLAYLEHDIARWDLLLSPNAASTARLRTAFGYRGPGARDRLPAQRPAQQPQRDEVRAAVRADLGIADDQTSSSTRPTWRDDLVFTGPGRRTSSSPSTSRTSPTRLGAGPRAAAAAAQHGHGPAGGRRAAAGARRLRSPRHPRPVPRRRLHGHRLLLDDVRLRRHRKPMLFSPTTWRTSATSCAASTSTSRRSPRGPLAVDQLGVGRTRWPSSTGSGSGTPGATRGSGRTLLPPVRTGTPPSASSPALPPGDRRDHHPRVGTTVAR
jgi:hypothetical protein